MKMSSKSLAETSQFAQEFLKTLTIGDSACVVALHGDLGSGKTTFTKLFSEKLGVEENVHSPTFVIMKVYGIDYAGFKKLIHIDAYRLEKESELLHLGWEELISEPENLILIEWPERVAGVIPENAKKINFKFIDENVREIETYES